MNMYVQCSCVQNTGEEELHVKSLPLVLKDKRSWFSQGERFIVPQLSSGSLLVDICKPCIYNGFRIYT